MLVLFCDRVESISRVAGKNIRPFQISIKRAQDCDGSVCRLGRMQWVEPTAAKMPKGVVF
jgi:hypothetical protein